MAEMDNRMKLLTEMFSRNRVEKTIGKCVDKGINKKQLRELKTAEKLKELMVRIATETLEFEPGHQAAIPKDDGTDRIVYVGETTERFVCSLINESLFALCPQLVHKSCKSYQEGLGCGSSVQEFAHKWGKMYGKFYVVKTDYHHYFDDIIREKVFGMIDKIEDALGCKRGTEPVMNLLRKMFSNDLLFDLDNNLIEKWSGIRQGNAVGSFFADAILYDIDEYMSNKYPYYVRYSDDCITLSEDPAEVKDDLIRLIKPYGVTLNPKKVEVHYDDFVKFLGFNVNGYNITLSESRIDKFQKDLFDRVRKCVNGKQATKAVVNYLYKGNGKYSFGTSVLGVINVESDIQEMNNYVMDLIRLTMIKKRKTDYLKKWQVGGIGVETWHKDYTLVRVPTHYCEKAAKLTPKEIDGYYTLACMRKNLLASRNVYDTIVRSL